MITQIHSKYVYSRRVKMLQHWIEQMLPASATRVLDVGSGDGLILARLQQLHSTLQAQGIDVLPRAQTYIPVAIFDGKNIPYDDESFDAVLLIDVLHHAQEPAALLSEAKRVTRHCLIIKDHFCEGWLANERLKLMDYVGNARYGVALPYNYWTSAQWHAAFSMLKLNIEEQQSALRLYPWFAEWCFGSSLHFVARLVKE